MMEFLAWTAVAIAIPAAILGLLQILAPESAVHGNVRRWVARFKLWQLAAFVVVCGLVFSLTQVSAPIVPFMMIGLIGLALFLKGWREEFVFLMGLRDDEFPGRRDKLVWIIFMVSPLAPLGAWAFRAYRLAHWPQSEPVDERATAASPVAPTPTGSPS